MKREKNSECDWLSINFRVHWFVISCICWVHKVLLLVFDIYRCWLHTLGWKVFLILWKKTWCVSLTTQVADEPLCSYRPFQFCSLLFPDLNLSTFWSLQNKTLDLVFWFLTVISQSRNQYQILCICKNILSGRVFFFIISNVFPSKELLTLFPQILTIAYITKEF